MEAVAVGSLVAGVLGTGVSMFGSYESAQAQSQAANYQAQVARNNQIIANQNAGIALQQGQQQEQTQRIKTGEIIGNELAVQGASGVNPNKGSSLDVRSSTAETGELDALTIRYNSQLQARNYQLQGQMSGEQASLYSAQAGWDTQAGYLGMGSSILGGASSVSDKWLRYQMNGIFGNNSPNPAGGAIGAWGGNTAFV